VRSVVVAGASLAGLSAARRLRERGFDGTITLIGDEPHLPYQRPPLSKQFLTGAWERPKLDLRVPDAQFVWRLGTRAERLDCRRRVVHLQDGDAIPFDGLIVTTGARPKQFSGCEDIDGIFTLRTVDDAAAIRERIARGVRKVAIVGAGFIGSEVASSLRKLGCDVTLIDMDRLPMQRVLGEALGSICADLHRSHGVHLELGVKYAGMVGSPAVRGVRLEDRRIVEAEIVIVGIGVTPNIEWLRDSGLELGDGVICDAACAAGERIVAAGDVARWNHPRYGSLRVEHWDNAIAQGEAAAETLLAAPGSAHPFAMIPFFWSDQHDCKLQLIGMAQRTDELRFVEGTPETKRFVAVFLRDERVVAAFLFNSMHRALAYKKLVESGGSLEAVPS
jgi:3-phenylpropionate/trans-cinnamate dioxygenase ferredoxin reductase subunit